MTRHPGSSTSHTAQLESSQGPKSIRLSQDSVCFKMVLNLPLQILFLLALCSIILACEDETFSERSSPTFATESEHYIFPPPNFESQSSELEIRIQNNGGSPLIIAGVTYEEMDGNKEVADAGLRSRCLLS